MNFTFGSIAAILGFVGMGLIAIILSAVGYFQEKKNEKKPSKLNTSKREEAP